MKNFLQLDQDEKITSVITFHEDDINDDVYLLMVTKKGVTKRVQMTLFRNARSKGIKAILLDEGDELIETIMVKDHDEVMFISASGKGLRVSVDDIRSMGRTARGVRAMNLIGDDQIVSAVKVEEGKNILLLTELGKGKRTGFDSFSIHGRGTMGQRIYSLAEGDKLVGATSVSDDDDVILITKLGQVLRIAVSRISYQGKNASGVIIATFKKKNDRINAMDITIHEDVVEEDEKDNAVRMILNFGHTIGHAVESYYHYETYTHGSAVAIGMCMMSEKTAPKEVTEKLKECVKRYNLPVSSDAPCEKLIPLCANDKKRKSSSINYIVCEKIGKAEIKTVEFAEFEKTFSAKE